MKFKTRKQLIRIVVTLREIVYGRSTRGFRNVLIPSLGAGLHRSVELVRIQ